MPDITLCTSSSCHLSEKCKRKSISNSVYQPYCDFSQMNGMKGLSDKKEACDFFIKKIEKVKETFDKG